MPEYNVTWTIDSVDADTPEGAARWCRDLLRDPSNTANVFIVGDERGNETEIDLPVEPYGIWLLIIEHNYGMDGSLHRSKEDAERNLLAWVTEYWNQDGPKGDMPDDPDEAIEAFFNFADESYMLSEATLPAKENA